MLDENSVTLSGGDIASSKIVGGYAQEGSRPKAHDNTVIIKDGVNFTNDKTQIYGGMKGSTPFTDAFNGNKLQVYTKNISLGNLNGFEFLEFYLPSDIKDKDTIITLTSTTSDNAPNFEHSKFGVGVIEGGGKVLKQGDRINLIYDKNKHMIVPTDTTKHYTLMQGVSKEYTFSIETQDKEYIYAKIDTAPVIPGTDDNPTNGDTPNNPDTGNTGGTGETEKPTEKPNPTNPSTGDNTGTPSTPGDTGNTGETGSTGTDTGGTTPTPINPNPNTPVSGSNNTPSNPSTGDNTGGSGTNPINPNPGSTNPTTGDNTGGSGTNPINPNPGSTNPTTPAYNTKFTKDKSFLEAGLGGAGAINAGADMVSSDGIKSMKASAIAVRGDMSSFAVAGASKLKYKTGSYVDTKGKMR